MSVVAIQTFGCTYVGVSWSKKRQKAEDEDESWKNAIKKDA